MQQYTSFRSHVWLFREFVRWRSGETPAIDPAEVPRNWTDLERYWELEFAHSAGGEPRVILQRLDPFLAERPETRAEALSLRAELLAELGQEGEAAELAQSALELVRAQAAASIIARGHTSLVEDRVQRLRGEDPPEQSEDNRSLSLS